MNGSDGYNIDWEAYNHMKLAFARKNTKKPQKRREDIPPSERATEKQLNYIKSLEADSGVLFTGVTKLEASQYIRKHKRGK